MKGYNHFGVMLDMSRNAIMNLPSLKNMINILSKMGYNALELYTEDTYEIKNEDFFGYLRGGYSIEEIKEIDAYANSKKIELIPCVQTLAHFTNLVKLPHYKDIVDINDILLIDEEKTYEFIDKIFNCLAEAFSSRNVNIGMDEAHFVGLGKHLDNHGYVDKTELFIRHLNRVINIAEKYGFKSHMWSDMFFRLANKGAYYGKNIKVEKLVKELVPKDIGLVYWDYYHTDKTDYDEMIKAHQQFEREIWFAGGAWTWNGFAPLNNFTLKTMKSAMESVIEYDIKNVLITMWGDDGKECSFFSALPSLYAIKQNALGNFDEEKIKQGFYDLFKIKFDDFMKADLPNISKIGRDVNIENPCKCLLYSDCFLGIFDEDVKKTGKIFYGDYAKELEKMKGLKNYGYIFDTLSKLCSVLEIKYDLGIRTREFYKQRNKKELLALAKNDYAIIVKRLKIFYIAFNKLWHKENKPFGFEIQQLRLGGLILRISSCKQRLEEYCSGKINIIEELEKEILLLNDLPSLQNNQYRNIVSISNI